MPMIDLTLPAGVLDDHRKRELVEQLTDTVASWEGISDEPRVRATVWTFVDERPAGAMSVGGRPPDEPHYRVEVTVAEGSLDDERKAGLVEDVTRLVLEAEGSPNELIQAARVWCHVRELPDGNWGAAGRIWRLPDIAEFAGIDPDRLPARPG